MNPKRKIIPEKIGIRSIKALSGSITCPSEFEATRVHAHECSFELSMALNVEKSLVGFKLTVVIAALDSKKIKLDAAGSYTHEMIFHVGNLPDFLEEEGTEHTIDFMLGSTLVGILYSTVRGLIFARTQGTSLGVVTLPVLDPKKLMVPAEMFEKHKVEQITDKTESPVKNK